jgi:hypothetical protein
VERFDRMRQLRDEYEAALDEAELLRAKYHREVVKLYRSGVSLREIAEHLGVSHQRVHQIVGVAEPRRGSRRGVTGAIGALLVLAIVAGLFMARSSDPSKEEHGGTWAESTGVLVTIAPADRPLPGCDDQQAPTGTPGAAQDLEGRSGGSSCADIVVDGRAEPSNAGYMVATEPLSA